MIEVRNISKTYGKKKNLFQALKNVSFKIENGSSVAIIGKSGSGKSTLIHAMSGLDAPEKGEVLMDGVNILSMNQKKIDKFRSKKMGFIFQSFFVQGNETCFENVSLPLEIAEEPIFRRKEIIEKQRLAIARAIVNSPEIIFADEPTGNLDSVTSEKIEKLLLEYNKESGATLFIITHDEELAKKCDVQIRIKDGEIEDIKGVKNA